MNAPALELGAPSIHPICKLLPDMSADEFVDLRNSIKDRGLINPIELYEGQVLDGRHRQRACIELDIAPDYVQFAGGDPWMRVWDRNGARREWSGGSAQKYAVWLILKRGSGEWQALHHQVQAAGAQRKSEAAKGNKRAAKYRGVRYECPHCRQIWYDAEGHICKKNKAATDSGTSVFDGDQHKGAQARAAAAGVDRGTAEKVESLERQDPEAVNKLASGEVNLAEAQRQAKREQVHAKAGELPEGIYRLIYADPPWQYIDQRKTDGGFDVKVKRESTAAGHHYPTMSKTELCALDVRAMRADDCVLLLWATFPLLPDALEVVKSWGFEYKTAFVWDKRRGAFGNYHKAEAELLIVAARGSGVPELDTRFAQIQRWPRAGHSRKPNEARAMLDKLWPVGRRVELFQRGEKPAGWEVWGNEAAQVAA